MNENYSTLLDISQVSVLIPTLIGCYQYRHLSYSQKIILLLLITTVLTEISGSILAHNSSSQNNLIVYNINAILLFGFFNRIYAKKINSQIISPLVNPILVSFLLFSFVNLIFFQPIDTYNSYMLVLSYFIFVIMSVGYFYQTLLSNNNLNWINTSFFWFNSGVLIYYSAALIFFLFVNNIIASSQETIEQCWTLNALLYIVLNCFYAISLWKPDHTSTT